MYVILAKLNVTEWSGVMLSGMNLISNFLAQAIFWYFFDADPQYLPFMSTLLNPIIQPHYTARQFISKTVAVDSYRNIHQVVKIFNSQSNLIERTIGQAINFKNELVLQATVDHTSFSNKYPLMEKLRLGITSHSVDIANIHPRYKIFLHLHFVYVRQNMKWEVYDTCYNLSDPDCMAFDTYSNTVK